MAQKQYVESLDEIVFAKRNKEYGAYVLRKWYNKRMNASLAISLVVIFIIVGYPVLANYLNKAKMDKNIKRNVSAEMETIKKADDTPPPPPPPPPEEAKQLAQQVKYTAPVVVDTVPKEQVILSIDDLKATTGNTEVNTNAGAVVIVEEKKEVVVEKKKEEVFFVVEEMPQFPGGELELQKFIANNVKYPASARENGIKGKVYIRFAVTSTGKVDQVQVARPVDPLLDAEAIRVVKLLPDWTPGKQQGVAVSVWYTVPINFQLSE